MTKDEIRARELQLAAKVCSLTSGTLLLNMRFLAKALSRLPAVSYEGTFACDGRNIRYDPHYLLGRYKKSERLPVHDMLHMVLHCIFRHWYIGEDIDSEVWSAACDIAVEALVIRLGRDFCANEREDEKAKAILELSVQVRPMTAEKLYAYFMKNEISRETIAHYLEVFRVDDHSGWFKEKQKEYEPEEQQKVIGIGHPGETKKGDDKDSGDDNGGDDQKQEQPEEGSDEKPDLGENEAEADDGGLEDWLDNNRINEMNRLEELWKELSKEIQSELENFDKGRGKDSRYLTQALEDVNRERYDYTAFLRKFAVTGEVIKPDLDQFDRNFYSYGLSLYGNVALVEPLEYKEVRLVRDFVIAVDTSGSVSGVAVQAFMRKTYSILKSRESFFTKVNIYIIQCDTEVRDAAKITCQADFERYIAQLEIKGLGGTDFKPVFEYVDMLRAKGELREMKGLIYFTDGLGDFPVKIPDYRTAFIFLRDDYERCEQPDVPPWAIKLILEEEDINDK